MRTYLYGLILTRNAHLIPSHITGIAGGTVRVLDCGDLGAIVSTLERDVDRSLDAVRAHDHALQSVVHHGATAAAGRFGQAFPSEDEAREHVTAHGRRVADVLITWDGCVEMRMLLPGAIDRGAGYSSTDDDPARATPGPGAGTAYLHRVRSEHGALSGLGLRAAIGPVVRAEKVEELPRRRGIAFTHLIDRSTEQDYRDAVAGLPALGSATLVGPLALHTFSEPG